ncbi:MAG: hypothetical protein ACYTGQ_10790 [Planctomycetota bacterium]|jgi:hypothetical protein
MKNLTTDYRALVLMAGVVLVGGCASEEGYVFEFDSGPRAREVAAVGVIESNGGSVVMRDTGHVVTIEGTDPSGTAACFDALAGVRGVVSLYLKEADAKAIDWKLLGEIETLDSLTVMGVGLSDKEVDLIAGLGLSGVHLYGTGLTDGQLARLAEIEGLRELSIGYGSVSDGGLGSLNGALGLRKVRLVGTGLSLLAAQGLCDANDFVVVDLDGVRLRGYRAGE